MKSPYKENQIEKMARVIEVTEQIARDAHCGLPSPRMYATDLFEKGCRMQSEDSVEVVRCQCTTIHGEWIVNQAGFIICSECKTLGTKSWKRCPVCEAKMDGKIGNNNNRKGELPF